MNPRSPEPRRVLAIDPTSRGFGFVVFEGPEHLIDWAVVEIRKDKEDKCLQRMVVNAPKVKTLFLRIFGSGLRTMRAAS